MTTFLGILCLNAAIAVMLANRERGFVSWFVRLPFILVSAVLVLSLVLTLAPLVIVAAALFVALVLAGLLWALVTF